MKGRRSSSGSLFDKLLVPRLENYGQNHDLTDTDAACEYLRAAYKEYGRQKLPALRQQVERAVEAIARKGGVTKAELRLQVRRGCQPRPISVQPLGAARHVCCRCATHRPHTHPLTAGSRAAARQQQQAGGRRRQQQQQRQRLRGGQRL